jgi:THO complex subunit 7
MDGLNEGDCTPVIIVVWLLRFTVYRGLSDKQAAAALSSSIDQRYFCTMDKDLAIIRERLAIDEKPLRRLISNLYSNAPVTPTVLPSDTADTVMSSTVTSTSSTQQLVTPLEDLEACSQSIQRALRMITCFQSDTMDYYKQGEVKKVQVLKTLEEIDKLEEFLAKEESLKEKKLQWDSIAQRINEMPTCADSQVKQHAVELEIQSIQEEIKHLDDLLLRRKQQIVHFLEEGERLSSEFV